MQIFFAKYIFFVGQVKDISFGSLKFLIQRKATPKSRL